MSRSILEGSLWQFIMSYIFLYYYDILGIKVMFYLYVVFYKRSAENMQYSLLLDNTWEVKCL